MLSRAEVVSFLGRQFLCKFGWHTRPVGYGVDACARACGFMHNPGSVRNWCVTLRSGESFEVTAVNEYHAASKIVYGNLTAIHVENCQVIEPPTRVHRDNIMKVELLQ